LCHLIKNRKILAIGNKYSGGGEYMKNVAINGFGRIGRNAFKIIKMRSDLKIVAINDLTDTKTLAHLLKYDSNYGTYESEVSYDDDGIIVDGEHIKVCAVKDPAELPWKELAVDVVIESTGLFVKPELARAHIDKAGAKRVVISAPAKGEGAKTIVLGVNDDDLKTDADIFSNASCTTNCIAPVMAVLEANFGIDKAMMTTVHSYTASQKLQDAPAKDLREARNAAENIVPTTTGASIAASLVVPSLKDRFGGLSVRVPTPVVSISDITAVLKRNTTAEEINEVFKQAAQQPYYQGILSVSEDELVSSDFKGNSHSAIVDLPLTSVIGGNLIKVCAWYDNEWGYSNRLVEVTADVARLLPEENTLSNTNQVNDFNVVNSVASTASLNELTTAQPTATNSDQAPSVSSTDMPDPIEVANQLGQQLGNNTSSEVNNPVNSTTYNQEMNNTDQASNNQQNLNAPRGF
jgi:glyceraldehyde-3-phosphate dehydrogenase, type I